MASNNTLSLGPHVIQLFIPHRRPFLMVDRIVYFSLEPQPIIRTIKYLSANETFFDGHFPGIALMPGAMTFEGLGQSANILSVFLFIRKYYMEKGLNPDDFFEDLKNIEYGFSFNRAFRQEKKDVLRKLVKEHPEPKYGLVGAVNLKFLEPIIPGNKIEYEVILTGEFENYKHFQLDASVDGKTKAKGTLSSIQDLGVIPKYYGED